jgi:hypothetical protein
MKQCSQCHFTFDDYVEFCDFDSTELTAYSEPVHSPKNASLLLEGSFFIRLFTSRVFVSVLAMAGVISSALLIGYYDAVSESHIETVENSERREAEVSHTPQVDVPKKPPAQTRVLPPRGSRIQFRVDVRAQSGIPLRAQSPIKSPVAIGSDKRARPKANRQRRGGRDPLGPLEPLELSAGTAGVPPARTSPDKILWRSLAGDPRTVQMRRRKKIHLRCLAHLRQPCSRVRTFARQRQSSYRREPSLSLKNPNILLS